METDFLFNTYDSRIVFNYLVYHSAEHFYQSERFKDTETIMKILHAETGQEARKIATKAALKHPENIVDNWAEIEKPLLKKILHEKFFQSKRLGQALIHTEGYLEVEDIEGNQTWNKEDNRLGKMIMMVRNDLIKTFGLPSQEKQIDSKLRDDPLLNFIKGIRENDTFNASYEKSVEDKYMTTNSEKLLSYLLQINGLRGEVVTLGSLTDEGLPISHSVLKAGQDYYDIRGRFSSIGTIVEEIPYFKDKDISISLKKATRRDCFTTIPKNLKILEKDFKVSPFATLK